MGEITEIKVRVTNIGKVWPLYWHSSVTREKIPLCICQHASLLLPIITIIIYDSNYWGAAKVMGIKKHDEGLQWEKTCLAAYYIIARHHNLSSKFINAEFNNVNQQYKNLLYSAQDIVTACFESMTSLTRRCSWVIKIIKLRRVMGWITYCITINCLISQSHASFLCFPFW